MKMIAALLSLASTPEDALSALPKRWAGLTVIVLAFVAGGGAVAAVGEFRSHEPRIIALEEWRRIHTDTVTGPGLERISVLEERADSTMTMLARIEGMVDRLYCDRWPEECEGRPAHNGGGP